MGFRSKRRSSPCISRHYLHANKPLRFCPLKSRFRLREVSAQRNLAKLMDLFPNEQNFDLDKSRQKFHHSLKEHHKISNISKFRFSVILYYAREIDTFFRKRYQFPARNTK